MKLLVLLMLVLLEAQLMRHRTHLLLMMPRQWRWNRRIERHYSRVGQMDKLLLLLSQCRCRGVAAAVAAAGIVAAGRGGRVKQVPRRLARGTCHQVWGTPRR
jgi:hypothetical protein